MNVAADEFFNSLADDSDIIRSGPIIKWHIILRYVNAERGKYFFTVWNIFNGRSYINLPERFGFIFLGGALTLFDLISGVIPLIIRCSGRPEMSDWEAEGEWRQESWHVILTDMRHSKHGDWWGEVWCQQWKYWDYWKHFPQTTQHSPADHD